MQNQSTPVTIYRIENENGVGPFQNESWPSKENYSTFVDIFDFGSKYYSHPTPMNDAGPPCWYDNELGEWKEWYDKYNVCGCRTKQQLVHWFPHHIRKFLKENGYKVVVYISDRNDVHFCNRQILFIKEKSFKVA